MKSIKKMLISVALVSTAFGAEATTINLGSLPSGYTQFGDFLSSGSFTDTVNFSLSGPSNAGFGVGPLNFSIRNIPYLNINNLSMSLFDDSNNLLGSGLDFSVAALTAGSYHLDVSGTVTGLVGGMYGGAINVTPVPEAKTYSMMLVGLGLMGFIARRRRLK